MTSKQSKKVHYTSSTKGSSILGDGTTSSLNPKPSNRRPSISHTRHPSDSGIGSSISSPTSHSASSSFFSDKERDEQRRNTRALNEVVDTLKDRVEGLERENRRLNDDLQESNREKREMRKEREEMLRMIDELNGKVASSKEKVKNEDGIRVRGGNVGVSTPEKNPRERERIPVTVERNTPPMTRREKERDSEARKREEERLRSQHQNRERRSSFMCDIPTPTSPLYRDDNPMTNPMGPRYRDEEKRKSISPIPPSPLKEGRLPNPFTPLPNTQRSSRRASVSYGSATSGGYTTSQGYPRTGTGYVVGSGVPYVRGEVEVDGRHERRVRVDAGDDLFPNDGKYHPYPLQ